MKKNTVFFWLVILLLGCSQESKEDMESYPFRNTSLTYQERVDNLISLMSLPEKVSQMRYDAPAIERLGIPAYNWWNECLHGVGRAGEATVFPQAIGMAAMWDSAFMHKIGIAVSDEARAKHHYFADLGYRGIYQGLTFWTPNINIFRDPRWGRGQETYGEDPYLTSRLAVNYIKGLQGDDPRYFKVIATSKHFAVHSGPEKTRHSDNYHTSERDLRHTYLPAFEATVKEANVQSVMCAYNRYRDEACCGSNLLLEEILRKEWGFSGYVVSDCWAINDFYVENRHGIATDAKEASALAVARGTDLNCGNTFDPNLVAAVQEGLLPETVLDKALARLMLAKIQLGIFDPPAQVPYTQIPYDVVRSQKHLEMGLKAARQSLVLLKNENKTLPLSKNLKSIAVIGPNADDEQVLLGNYHGTATQFTSPLAAIKEKIPAASVTYREGSFIAPDFPLLRPISGEYLSSEGKAGLKASYYGNIDWSGEPALVQRDSALGFKWTLRSPVSNIMADTFSVRWTGDLEVPISGTYRIGVKACNFARLRLDGLERFEFENIHHPITKYIDLELKVGTKYPLEIDFYSYHTDPQAYLVWARLEEDRLTPALNAARAADATILFLGLSPDIEGEEMPIALEGFDKGDRTLLGLPAPQVELMQKIVALGKPTILILLNGSALAVNWADKNVPAILEAWYPGEFGGQAIADALFGDYNPGGRLPVTFYASEKDLPAFDDYSMKNRTYQYFSGTPLYPFGHGLSYTNFTYADLSMPKEVATGEGIEVSVKVTNNGEIAGDEVVQLYLSGSSGEDGQPLRTLQGFERISLQSGETKEVRFRLLPKQLAQRLEDGTASINPGELQVAVGGKQPGFTGNADANTTQVLLGNIRIVGESYVFPQK